jgi:hypothetical protein
MPQVVNSFGGLFATCFPPAKTQRRQVLKPGYSLQSFCTNPQTRQQKGFPLLSLAGRSRKNKCGK